jgi:hypothetical protein
MANQKNGALSGGVGRGGDDDRKNGKKLLAWAWESLCSGGD